MTEARPVYVTTPIYYVNDRPHIGHCYTTLLADVAARAYRLMAGAAMEGSGAAASAGVGDAGAGRVFFLTGTDEHADKVVTTGAAHGKTPLEWATINAQRFRDAFAAFGISNDDFVRTTEARHTAKVAEYVRRLQASGDIYLGEYVGWWDASQEEYLTESTARESPKGAYTSPVTGQPLVKRTEKNYFFRLSKYEAALKAHIDSHPGFIQPGARRNEVLGRIRQGLQDIPISRAVTEDAASQWGIRMPDDPGHRIYVWIDALFNYLSVVDTAERRELWPARVHVMAKDILWFHAVIWPALLMSLGEALPGSVYVHSYWVRDGQKMSKSLGNFIEIDLLLAYARRYSLDAVRWYLVTQGPLHETDADFSHAKFVEVYNAELANGIGNCASRVGNMIEKYFGGELPDALGLHRYAYDVPTHGKGEFDWKALTARLAGQAMEDVAERFDVAGAVKRGIELVRAVDLYIGITEPFRIAKKVEAEPDRKRELAAILYNCAEALRIASLLLAPALPEKMKALWAQWGCGPAQGVGLRELAVFAGPHGLKPGQRLTKGEALFMRADTAEAAPTVE